MQDKSITKRILQENLRNAMKRRNLTQMGLANEIGTTQATISKWLNGSIPQADQLHLAAECLGVSMEWLLAGETDPPTGKAPPKVPSKQARKALRDARAALDRLESELDSNG